MYKLVELSSPSALRRELKDSCDEKVLAMSDKGKIWGG